MRPAERCHCGPKSSTQLGGQKATRTARETPIQIQRLRDGTVSFASSPANGNTLTFFPIPSVSPFQGSGNRAGTSSWAYANGVVTIVGGAPPLSVSAGGRVLVGATANYADGTNVLT